MVSPTARATWNLPRTWYPPSRSLAFGIFLETCEKFCENEHVLLSTDFTFWGLCAHRDHRDLDDHRDGKAKKRPDKKAKGRLEDSKNQKLMTGCIFGKSASPSPQSSRLLELMLGLDIFSLLSEAAGRMVSLESVGGSLEPRARTTWKTGWRPKSVKPSAVYFPGRDQESKFAEVPNLI